MRSQQANSEERIWEGRIHLGDEPGIYGDAAYSGLATEFPVTLHPFNPAAHAAPDVTFHLEANRVTIYPPYKGHRVSVFAYGPDAGTQPPTWSKTLVADALMDKASLEIKVPGLKTALYLSIRIEAATDVAPGLYDDFIVRSLALESTTHYADFGFHSPDPAITA